MRERVAGILHRTGALQGLLRLRARAPVPTVSIITYHHVQDHDPAYPYDPDVADATPAQFRWQMEALAKHCTPIGIDELLRAFDGAPLPKNPVMVTFDDGYLSCHDTALPILRAVGIRATFFIATNYITERRLYWWERVAMLVGRLLMIVPILAIAGSMARKRAVPPSLGTFPTTGPLWVGLLIGTIVIIGALTYFPALALGPLVEHLLLRTGKLFTRSTVLSRISAIAPRP